MYITQPYAPTHRDREMEEKEKKTTNTASDSDVHAQAKAVTDFGAHILCMHVHTD